MRTAEWWRGPRKVPLSRSYTRLDNSCREAGVDAFLTKPVNHEALLNTIGVQLSLRWNTGKSPLEPCAADEEEGGLVIPPAQEIEALWQLVRSGNMFTIREQTDYLAALDSAYTPFAQRRQMLAQSYQSKALAAFVACYRAESVVPPL